MSRIWQAVGGALALLAGALALRLKSVQLGRVRDRARRADEQAQAARRQTDHVTRAQRASEKAAARGKGETDEAVERARRGDFGGYGGDW